jgi:hypothetical protein
MSKKRLVLLSGGALVVLLLVGLAGGTLALADETDLDGPGPGWFGFGGRSWTLFDKAAEVLGVAPDALFSKLHDEGKSLTDIAEEQGVATDALQEAMNASRAETMRERIQQSVEDGDLSQEQADWMLEGLDKGFMGGRHGHGMGPGGFGPAGGPFGEAQR